MLSTIDVAASKGVSTYQYQVVQPTSMVTQPKPTDGKYIRAYINLLCPLETWIGILTSAQPLLLNVLSVSSPNFFFSLYFFLLVKHFQQAFRKPDAAHQVTLSSHQPLASFLFYFPKKVQSNGAQDQGKKTHTHTQGNLLIGITLINRTWVSYNPTITDQIKTVSQVELIKPSPHWATIPWPKAKANTITILHSARIILVVSRSTNWVI